MNVAGYLKTSLIDYPNTVASVVYTSSCNFRCDYCHNKDLVDFSESLIEHKSIFDHLSKRKNILDGVVITGGEPTLQRHLIPFIRSIKQKGFVVKLDTNGHEPEVLEQLINEDLLDYVAMDIKNGPSKYDLTTCVDISMENIKRSIHLIQSKVVDYEFRTTWIKEFHTTKDLHEIGQLIKNSKRYVFQQYQYSEKQIKNKAYTYYTLEEMGRLKNEIKVHYNIEDVLVKGRF